MTMGLKANADGSGAIQVGGSDAITISTGLASTFAAGVSGTTGSFSGNMSFNSGYGSAAVAYGCRAWVNFNGTGTVAINASGNITSITDNGTGDYTLNFTTAMPDANYSATTMSLAHDTAGTTGNCNIRGSSGSGATTMTTTALRINTGNTPSNIFVDRALVTVAIFR